MYIKCVELDGFKSYGRRTLISDFDPAFNAITGLNGSGKSNILDAICFVLGLTNLQHVRASSFLQLIYKNGQTGLTRARVSVMFDNSDPEHCPIGFENVPVITITREATYSGRSRYVLNGSPATAKRIQDLFQSVQLNVNNPHFLIMQGKINKVLNMKPHEILSMVEEAIGVGMYETKRQYSLKLIQDKRAILAQFNKILDEEICPLLTRLNSEYEEYLAYQTVIDEYNQLKKLLIAWDYTQTKRKQQESLNEEQNALKEIKEIDRKWNEQKVAIDLVEHQIREYEIRRSNISKVLEELENDLKEKTKQEALFGSRMKKIKLQINDNLKEITDINEKLNEKKAELEKKDFSIKCLEENAKKLKFIFDKDCEAKEIAIKKLQDANVGLFTTSSEGEAETFAAELITLQKELASAQTEKSVAIKKLSFLKKTFEEKQAERKETETSYKKISDEYSRWEREVHSVKTHLNGLTSKLVMVEELRTKKLELEEDSNGFRGIIDDIYSRFPQLSFKYTDPEINFDRRRVLGLVCELFKVKDFMASTALEIVAGSRLYNVVVDNENTGKLLLSKGGLKQRWTVIPLSKITSHVIPKSIVSEAESLVGKNNVRTALSVLEYDENVAKAVEYVFGGIFICSDMDSARRLSNCKHINRKCVTLDGEIFDPAGTVSGGSLNRPNDVIPELIKLNTAREILNEKQLQYQRVLGELQRLQSEEEKFKQLSEELIIKKSRLKHLKNQLENSTYYQLKEELSSLQESIDEQNDVLEKSVRTIKVTDKKVSEMQVKVDNAKDFRDNIIKKMNEAVDECQKKVQMSENNYLNAKTELEKELYEITEIKADCNDYQVQINNLKNDVKKYEQDFSDAEIEHERKKVSLSNALEKVKSQKKIFKINDEDIEDMLRKKKHLMKLNMDLTVEKTSLEYKAIKSKEESEKASNKIERLFAAHTWIKAESQFFGVPKSNYDFSDFDFAKENQRFQKLEGIKKNRSVNVNFHAEATLRQAEKRHADLVKNKLKVIMEEGCLHAAIIQIDERKKLALHTAYQKLNRDFNSIFSALLPDAVGELVLHEDDNKMTGVSFKIGFGGTWKESLSELSGGQRSLVALSWILSLLIYKPAPIYILDEIDAALDLSHTQNIGAMLRTHFLKSQFIIVSLKPGMFNNANVIFNTRHRDGMSTVTRTTHNIMQQASSDIVNRRVQDNQL